MAAEVEALRAAVARLREQLAAIELAAKESLARAAKATFDAGYNDYCETLNRIMLAAEGAQPKKEVADGR